ncbi:hypothetical protein XENTR_v10000873 [Xenopus tropicalis]|nr:hypothetical protein XENTR_v10000873 [Xenopus tropicalis]
MHWCAGWIWRKCICLRFYKILMEKMHCVHLALRQPHLCFEVEIKVVKKIYHNTKDKTIFVLPGGQLSELGMI